MEEKDLKNFLNFMTRYRGLTKDQIAQRDKLLLRDIYSVQNRNNQKKSNKSLSPLNTATFLAKFNDSMALKYLTHDFDDENDGRPRTMKEILSAVDENLKEYNNIIPNSLYLLINNFAHFGNWLDTYNEKGRPSYFGNPKLISWSENNNNSHPKNCPEFANEIEAFRSTIRVKGASTLDKMCNKIGEDLSMHITQNKIGSADFYTNTHSLYFSLRRVFQQMHERINQYPNISISLNRSTSPDGHGHLLRNIIITQEGSFSPNSIEDVKNRLRLNGEQAGDFGSIRNNLNGYCLWQVESIWDGVPCRWNILKTQEMDDLEYLQREDIIGFTHIFTFYIV